MPRLESDVGTKMCVERVSHIFIEAVLFLQCLVMMSRSRRCYTCKGLEAWDWGRCHRTRHNAIGLIEHCIHLPRMA